MLNDLNNHAWDSQKGFTLLELIVTISITVIFMGIVSASLTSSEKRSLEEAAILLQDNLRYAQRMSVVEGRRYQVVFNLTGNYYEIRRRATDDASSYDERKIIYLTDGVEILSTNAPHKTVEYTSTGTTGDACTIALSAGAYRINLTIAVGSGRISKKEISKINQ